MPYPYCCYTDEEGDRTLTVFLPTGPLVVAGDHPHFDRIQHAAENGGFSAVVLVELFDLGLAILNRTKALSDRVSVKGDGVYFDGDLLDNAVTAHLIRCLDEGSEDWRPLVAFLDNLGQNPNDHSREQLADWLAAHDFTITADGRIVAYKGVEKIGPGRYRSRNAGTAYVNNRKQEGRIEQRDGDVVTMARATVAHDPRTACSTGLHVGTHSYAQSWANGALLRVLVNPRDVVSVPTDASGEKVRVCRYEIDGTIEQESAAPIDYTLGEAPVENGSFQPVEAYDEDDELDEWDDEDF